MDTLLWGIIVLISGVFISAYGSLLFRFALAFLGFAIGYSLVAWLGGGLDTALRILIGIVAGGILAAVLYLLVKFTLNIAGAVLGLVLMLALLGLFRLGGLDLGVFGTLLVVAARGPAPASATSPHAARPPRWQSCGCPGCWPASGTDLLRTPP